MSNMVPWHVARTAILSMRCSMSGLWGVSRTKAYDRIALLKSRGLIQMRTREQGYGADGEEIFEGD